MSIQRKQIIIVEGPAGSGKTTLLDRLKDIENVDIIRSSLYKRSFETEEAVVKSFYNDIDKLQRGLVSPSEVVFIDRCFISQLVYHSIREGSLPKPSNIEGYFRNFYRLILTLNQDLAIRSHSNAGVVELTYMFLIPSVKQLEFRRALRGKDYPNSASQEVMLYKMFSREVVLNHPSPSVIVPSYETLEEQDNLVRSLEIWIEDSNEVWASNLWKSLSQIRKGI